jgi:chitodextrinase
MHLPDILLALLTAQANYDSNAYANCFSESAIVCDEGEKYAGLQEIQRWNEKTNAKYKTVLEPIDCIGNGNTLLLTTKVSGTFGGSPIVLKYHFDLKDGLIASLKISN